MESELARVDCSPHAFEVAPRLLGLLLRHGDRVGRIVEVEAYGGADDPASHSFRGPYPRNAAMFGPPGRLYVYLSYGIHRCANVVCGQEGMPSAVLIRALEPVAGVSDMSIDRPRARRPVDLANGPGKLTAALGIELSHNGTDLFDQASRVTVEQDSTARALADSARHVAGPRIGITKAVERPWRFALSGNPHVSNPRRGLVATEGG